MLPVICRVFSLNPIPDYIPPTLTGHRTTPVGVFWAGMHSLESEHGCSAGTSCSVYIWQPVCFVAIASSFPPPTQARSRQAHGIVCMGSLKSAQDLLLRLLHCSVCLYVCSFSLSVMQIINITLGHLPRFLRNCHGMLAVACHNLCSVYEAAVRPWPADLQAPE